MFLYDSRGWSDFGRQSNRFNQFWCFCELPGGKTGMVHISEVANTYVKEIRDFVKENEMVKVKVLNIGDDGKVSLSMKQAVERPVAPPPPRRSPGEIGRAHV